MKYQVLLVLVATVAAVKQKRLASWPVEASPEHDAWGHRSRESLGIHGLTLLLALAALSTCAVGLGMFYFQAVRDAEALLKTRKFGESNAEGACCDAPVYGRASRAMFGFASQRGGCENSQVSQAKFKDCVNNGLAQPRTILVGQ
ncbi:unnamed protein product [Durusdinium trenchii]|uniref:Uncharacterized protein n=1 Tax=Durusdinium trenchii TaxID=1381693 RepID=A0ABP0I172_9DINO